MSTSGHFHARKEFLQAILRWVAEGRRHEKPLLVLGQRSHYATFSGLSSIPSSAAIAKLESVSILTNTFW